MSSRDRILSAVKNNQPEKVELPSIQNFEQPEKDNVLKFTNTLVFIGGLAVEVSGYNDVIKYINEHFKDAKRILSTLPELNSIAEVKEQYEDPHSLDDVQLTILKAQFGVAENGAIWITDDQLPARALPFISEYLAVVLERKNIVATMHDAYDKIGTAEYGFGVFIAGPSKTSDIEQSLVLGAHGPKGMTVFLV
ncbi:MAG TPA: LUD domain-containing protein [Cyclobacteriaceae bacterium]